MRPGRIAALCLLAMSLALSACTATSRHAHTGAGEDGKGGQGKVEDPVSLVGARKDERVIKMFIFTDTYDREAASLRGGYKISFPLEDDGGASHQRQAKEQALEGSRPSAAGRRPAAELFRER